MKNHLKRIATPNTWIIDRKQAKFIIKTAPGSHPREMSLPLTIILRDILKLARTRSEVQRILQTSEVLIDGKRRRDHRFSVGLFDTISLPSLQKHFRISLDNKGRLIVLEIPATESSMKVSKIIGKSMLSKGKVQYNLHDGKNLLSKEKAKVGDSFLLELPKLAVKEIFPLKSGASVFLTGGKHSGIVGSLRELRGKEATFTHDNSDIETTKNYLFVVGDKNPKITIVK
jgi:small subunit ribosomal protein S4e